LNKQLVPFWKLKWYVLHGVLVAIVFLSPAVQNYLMQNPVKFGTALLVWGWILHFAEGKLAAPPTPAVPPTTPPITQAKV